MSAAHPFDDTALGEDQVFIVERGVVDGSTTLSSDAVDTVTAAFRMFVLTQMLKSWEEAWRTTDRGEGYGTV